MSPMDIDDVIHKINCDQDLANFRELEQRAAHAPTPGKVSMRTHGLLDRPIILMEVFSSTGEVVWSKEIPNNIPWRSDPTEWMTICAEWQEQYEKQKAVEANP